MSTQRMKKMPNWLARATKKLFDIGSRATEIEAQKMHNIRHGTLIQYVCDIEKIVQSDMDEIDREFAIAEKLIEVADLACKHGMWLHENDSLLSGRITKDEEE